MLQQVTHIEGLDDALYENIEMTNDTDPRETLVTFFVQSEEMPGLSREAGRRIEKSFIWIRKIMNLGNAIMERRIRDKVEYDVETKKWKIKSLATQSDIKQYPEHWNAFMRGVSYMDVGTPLEVLFKADPARINIYKAKYINTVEQLASCTESHIQDLGMGSRSDVVRAKEFLAKAEKVADSSYFNNQLEAKDREIEVLRRQLEDFGRKFDAYMSSQKDVVTEPPKKGRPKKQYEVIEDIPSNIIMES